ncbi:MAG: hypothetical protein ABIQ93_02050 [Saprospiraceae bacterium]
MEESKKAPGGKKKNRETLLLILLAVVGGVGLVVVQFARKNPGGRNEDRSLVQAKGAEGQADPQATQQIQRIPGNLLHEYEKPEQDRPYKVVMENFGQGAVYELDYGEGLRKTFEKKELLFTFRKAGPHVLTLYAKYEGQEVQLDTLFRRVSPKPKIMPIAPIYND